MRLWRLSIVALVFGIAIMGFARTTADPDLWGHLRFGLDLLETGRVVRPDPYSYLTAGVTWVNHEWLAEALMAVAWRAAGAFGSPATGLVLLKLAMVVAVVAIVYSHLLWRGLSAIAAGTIVLAYLPVLLPWLGAVRPQMFTYVCFALTLAAIARAEAGEGSRERWGLWVLRARVRAVGEPARRIPGWRRHLRAVADRSCRGARCRGAHPVTARR